jgi:hypothetical protein
MQFPVPQFTDVEDKIIAGLSLKQFGILFATGTIIFLIFSATKNLPITIVAFLLFGIPGLLIAFAPFNGRKLYNTLPIFIAFLTRPRYYQFRKEASLPTPDEDKKDLKVETVTQIEYSDPGEKLRELQAKLEKNQAEAEKVLFK